ncbi:DUF6296 family protein [Streptomyces sp. NBC_00091]|uniref:DUF6296 family protein n=1 Tax=Streptomyces sp. NBC_00091 TaxID=2975648 RepID=UPI0022595CD9|nr:DUF6296 family protein [Streptomyces sp. NBC_00091]MCX5380611.1 DUF6296 family protein [Streptomyces sp. NBC_00091]
MSVRRYELTFPDADGTGGDTVIVERTESAGPGGHPVYADATGIVRAEISDRGEVRMLPSGGHQAPAQPTGARRLPEG